MECTWRATLLHLFRWSELFHLFTLLIWWEQPIKYLYVYVIAYDLNLNVSGCFLRFFNFFCFGSWCHVSWCTHKRNLLCDCSIHSSLGSFSSSSITCDSYFLTHPYILVEVVRFTQPNHTPMFLGVSASWISWYLIIFTIQTLINWWVELVRI